MQLVWTLVLLLLDTQLLLLIMKKILGVSSVWGRAFLMLQKILKMALLWRCLVGKPELQEDDCAVDVIVLNVSKICL